MILNKIHTEICSESTVSWRFIHLEELYSFHIKTANWKQWTCFFQSQFQSIFPVDNRVFHDILSNVIVSLKHLCFLYLKINVSCLPHWLTGFKTIPTSILHGMLLLERYPLRDTHSSQQIYRIIFSHVLFSKFGSYTPSALYYAESYTNRSYNIIYRIS